jgi:pimeloyl-ACP methyl ester carboxylesterase
LASPVFAALAITAVQLTPCHIPGVAEGLKCGVHEVYENRQTMRGRKLPLKIIVIPARNPHPDQGPVFFLTGGPGETDADMAADLVTSPERETHEIVLVDERGTGAGHRLDCASPFSDDNLQGYFKGPYNAESLKQCAAQLSQNFDLTQYTTANFADDLDEVRQAMGYDRINLEAGSFGTYAAMTYIHRHGEHVRSAYLSSLVVLDNKVPLNHARAAQEGLDALLTQCEADAACRRVYPTVRADIAEILARLRERPVNTWVRHPASGDRTPVQLDAIGFADGMRTVLYAAPAAHELPLLITKAKAGDFRSFAERAMAAHRNVYGGLRMGLSLLITCNEFVARIRPEEIEPAVRGTFLGDWRVRAQMAVCADWPRTNLPADYFAPFRSPVPTVLVSGEMDPATRPNWGEIAARSLPNSVHIVVPGGAHVPENACVSDVREQLFASGSVNGLDVDCVVQMRPPPFKLPEAAKDGGSERGL